MAIKGEDNRSIVTNFNIDGVDAVVGIDIPPSVQRENDSEAVTDVATGNLISPYHVLTAGHVVSDVSEASDIKVRLGENAADLPSRTRTPISSGNFDASGTNFSYPAPGFDGIGGKDLAIVTLNEQIGEPSRYIGLVTFIDPQDANSLQVTTAGFPGAVDKNDFASNEDGTVNIEESISKNAPFLITDENSIPSESLLRASGVSFLTDAVTMFTATGTIDNVNSDGQFKLDETLDGEQGQSGSGYWTYLEGDSEPRVLGVYSSGGGLFNNNFGALITTEAYDNIVATMQPSLKANNLTGNDLPENAIVGSNESDKIEGSYRRERILGNEGQDIIFGGGADDRLEGGAGYDVLHGEQGNDRLQGDGANDFLYGGEGDRDIAVFSDKFENYNYFELTGSTFGVAEQGLITIEHIGGTYADGNDTLVGVEWAQFGGNSNSVSNPPRIIPLPINDGSEKTKVVKVNDFSSSYNSNDLTTPPYVSLTAPVDMLDGDVNYTLNISLEETYNQYNVDYIVILSDGVLVDFITPSQLTDTPTGLTYKGLIDDLDTNINAKNIISAEVAFTAESNLDMAIVDFTVTAGQGEVVDANGNPIDESGNTSGDKDPFNKKRNGGNSDDEITLGHVDLGANGGGGGDYIVANRRANILNGEDGNDTIFGHEGNDTLDGSGGADSLIGGEGADSLIGGIGNDVLVAEGSGDVLKGGSGNDIYKFTLSRISGEVEIVEESGDDTIDLTEGSGKSVGLSLTDFGPGRVGIKKSDRDLLVDINRDGIIDPKSDLTVTNYFNENGAAGSGTIEQVGNVSSDAIIQYTQSSNITDGSTVYRFFNISNGVHFYTASEGERNFVQNNLDNYVFEGASYVGAPHDEDILTGAKPVYRFFNTNTGVHLYTMNNVERDSIIDNLPNYNFEGVAYYGYENPQENTQALYRFYNAVIDAHFYTPSAGEKDYIVANLPDYQLETNGNSDAAFYVQPLNI